MKFKWLVAFFCFLFVGCNDLTFNAQQLKNKVLHFFKKQESYDGTQGERYAKEFLGKASLLKEIYFVIYQKELKNVQEFLDYQNILMQGASLEGVYNGLTHSSRFRKLEVEHKTTKAIVVKIFADELWNLENELSVKTVFNKTHALPLARPIDPALFSGTENELQFEEKTSPQTKTEYFKLFFNASIFTLKRVIGDEALKVIASKENSKENLAAWYGRWTIKLTQYKVSFGCELRDTGSELFHRKWAQNVSVDILRWEVLNRLHRLLNEKNRD
ncbi:MAG: hypothetical protein HY843_01905 [Bdellovibrio sp.]|nr:hypothetical protein [Bdellovibrio sp.]